MSRCPISGSASSRARTASCASATPTPPSRATRSSGEPSSSTAPTIWQLPVIPGKLRVGPVLEAKGFVVEATLKAPATTPPLRETEKFAIALPSIGLAIDWSPHPVVDLFAEVSGLTLGDRGHVVDAEAGVR